CCCPLNSCTRLRRDQSWISTRDGPARPSTLPICPMPPTASCVPSGEKASERTPPIERIRCVPSQVYSDGASVVERCRPLETCHMTTWPTRSPVASFVPSFEKAQQ